MTDTGVHSAVAPHPAAAQRNEAAPATARSEQPATRSAVWSGPHPIDVRITIPLLFGRYYVALIAGKERRDLGRLTAERRKHPLRTPGNVVLFFVLGSLVGIAAFCALQLLNLLVLQELGMVVAQ